MLKIISGRYNFSKIGISRCHLCGSLARCHQIEGELERRVEAPRILDTQPAPDDTCQMFARFLRHRDLYSIRAYYFIWLGGAGFSSFISLYYRQQGLNGTQIGLLSTLSAVCGLLIGPLWGRWNDRAQRPRRMLQLSLAASALAFLAIGFQASFVEIASCIVVYALLSSGINPMSEAMALAVTRSEPDVGYGSIRRWGSLGWICVILPAGWLIDQVGLGMVFWGNFVALLLAVIPLGWMRLQTQSKEDKTAGPRPGLVAAARSVLSSRPLVGMSLALVLMWFSGLGVSQFQTLYLKSLGADGFLIGLASTTSAMIELPAMIWADRWVRRFGPGRVLRWGLLGIAARMAGVLLLPGVATIVFTNALMGTFFSMYSVATMIYIQQNAPQRQIAMVMALLMVTLQNLVRIVAGGLSGAMYDAFGGAYWLYAVGLGGALLAWLVIRISDHKKVSQTGQKPSHRLE